MVEDFFNMGRVEQVLKDVYVSRYRERIVTETVYPR